VGNIGGGTLENRTAGDIGSCTYGDDTTVSVHCTCGNVVGDKARVVANVEIQGNIQQIKLD